MSLGRSYDPLFLDVSHRPLDSEWATTTALYPYPRPTPTAPYIPYLLGGGAASGIGNCTACGDVPNYVVTGRGQAVAPLASTGSQFETVLGVLGLVGAVIGAYHGYKRNDSIGWAIGWSILGSLAPVIVIPVALAQGLGEKKKG